MCNKLNRCSIWNCSIPVPGLSLNPDFTLWRHTAYRIPNQTSPLLPHQATTTFWIYSCQLDKGHRFEMAYLKVLWVVYPYTNIPMVLHQSHVYYIVIATFLWQIFHASLQTEILIWDWSDPDWNAKRRSLDSLISKLDLLAVKILDIPYTWYRLLKSGKIPHLIWIHAAGSEKPELTDDCATTVALLTKPSI